MKTTTATILAAVLATGCSTSAGKRETPTPQPTAPADTATAQPTLAPASATPSPSWTRTGTATPAPSATAPPSATASRTATPTPTPTPAAPSPTASSTVTVFATCIVSQTATSVPSTSPCIALAGTTIRSARPERYCVTLNGSGPTWTGVGMAATDPTVSYAFERQTCAGTGPIYGGRGAALVSYILWRNPDIVSGPCERVWVPYSSEPPSYYWLSLVQSVVPAIAPGANGPYALGGPGIFRLFLFNPGGSGGTYTLSLAGPSGAKLFFHQRFGGSAIQTAFNASWSISAGGSYTFSAGPVDYALVLVNDGLQYGTATITRTP